MFGKAQRVPPLQTRIAHAVATYHPRLKGFPATDLVPHVAKRPMAAFGGTAEMDAHALRARAKVFHATVTINPLTGALYADVPVPLQDTFYNVLSASPDASDAALRVYGHTLVCMLDPQRAGAPSMQIDKSVPESANPYVPTVVAYKGIPVDSAAVLERAVISKDLLSEALRLTPRLAGMADSYRDLKLDLWFQDGVETNPHLSGAAAYQVLRPLLHSVYRPTSLLEAAVRTPLWMAAVVAGVATGIGFLYFFGMGPERLVLRPRFFKHTSVSINGKQVMTIAHVDMSVFKDVSVSFDETPIGAAMQGLWSAEETPPMWQGVPLWPLKMTPQDFPA